MDYGHTYGPRAIKIIYACYNFTMDWNQGPVCASKVLVPPSGLEIIDDKDGLAS
jgi:hypothetical protein